MDVPKQMMKAKAALILDGKVPTKQGRGRMNAEQIKRVGELVNLGWNIEHYTKAPAKAVTSTAEPVAPKVVRTAGPAEKQVIEPGPEMRSRDNFVPLVRDGNKLVRWPMGPLGICDVCRQSLTHCPCGDARVMYNGKSVPVVLEKVKT